MLNIQKYLKEHTFTQLANEHGVYASLSKNKRKISLNYSMLEAKDNDLLACECRGLILAKDDWSEFNLTQDLKLDMDIITGNTQIVACPMFRFLNLGQGNTNINLNDSNLEIFEKIDGSCVIVYFDSYKDDWMCATRSVPEADQLLDNGDYTFRQLFEKAVLETFKRSFNQFTNYLDVNKTYVFELTTPLNQIVVSHDKYSITLLAVRNLTTLMEENPLNEEIITELNCPTPQFYKLKSIEEIVDWVSTRDPTKHEGVILKDSCYRRIKIKSPAYVALSRIKNNLCASDRNVLELIFSEKDDDVLPLLSSEIVAKISNMKEKLIKMIKHYDNLYLELLEEATNNNPGDKKTFAQLVVVKEKLWVAPFFQMFDKKVKNTKDFLNKNKKSGTWSNSFLDKILEHIENF